MNLKNCFAAFISLALICFPYNIIGCGPGVDPYDYYTSFFSQKLSGDNSYRPFYYTGYRFLYDETEPISTKEITSTEWVNYTNNTATKKDVQMLVLKYPFKHLSTLYFHIEKKQPLTLPDSVKRNSFTQWFLQSKDLEALGYLMYAKQVEPFVTGDEDMWEEVNRDSIKMRRFIKNGIQLWTAAKKDFIKLRYAYQVTRLAHYSEQYNECMNYYDLYVKPNNTQSVLQQLALSLKAGALKNTGKVDEAAYTFSQLFVENKLKRKSNYVSFIFSTRYNENQTASKDKVLMLCKNNREKANVLGTYITNSVANNLPELKEIYQLDPSSALLELLTIREINKLEEKFLHPSISKLKGEKLLYSWTLTGWDNNNPNYDSLYNESELQVKEMISFCHTVAQNSAVINRGLYETAAAYSAYMAKDYKKAKELITSAGKLAMNAEVKDQLMLTNLLVTINEQQTISSSFEQQILPSIQWLEKKAKTDDDWKIFYRNLFSEIMAQRYIQQNEMPKAVLALGCAEKMMRPANTEEDDFYYFNFSSLEFLRTKMNSKEVETLYALLQSANKTSWETYLSNNHSFSQDDVSDIAGTAYLREHDWKNAERWFKATSAAYYTKEPYSTYLAANSFADLLFDTHAPTKQDNIKFTKLQFVQKMQQLFNQSNAEKNEQKAKALYQIANGLYQASYWGNSWMLQDYAWSGNDGLHNSHNKGSWQKEYYGVFKAEEYYLRAKEFSNDDNFKARCIFMAAKCSQKQNPVPQFEDFTNYDLYDKAGEQYAKTIRRNKYFSELTSRYKNTLLYKEVFNSCVYLQDYVKGKQ